MLMSIYLHRDRRPLRFPLNRAEGVKNFGGF